MKGILGKKLGMTQVFTTDGTLIPVTVIGATPNVVMQKKTIETDGYEAVQLGFEDVKEHRSNKPNIGHAKKADTAPKKFVREVRGNGMSEYEVGQEVTLDVFAVGDVVDATAISKGKGYTGAVQKNNQALGPKSHGSRFHRSAGSIATGGTVGKVAKGTVMAGQHGGFTTTNRNLEVVAVHADKNVILVKGNVPGPKRGLVFLKTTTKRIKQVEPVQLVNYVSEETAAEEE